eukprot:3013169-Prymnesium_polylepis.1
MEYVTVTQKALRSLARHLPTFLPCARAPSIAPRARGLGLAAPRHLAQRADGDELGWRSMARASRALRSRAGGRAYVPGGG